MNIAEIWELFNLPPVRRGFIALLLSGVSMPLIGVFIVGLNVYPLRFAIMHMALLGIALGQVFGIEPLLPALIMCAFTGRLLAALSERPAGAPGAMGFFMVVSIALAFLVLSIGGVHATAVFELLWGSVLAIRPLEILFLAGISVILLALFHWKHRELALLLYDREIAWCSKIPVRSLSIGMYILIAVAIGGAIRLTGALLVDAVTILPALSARNIGRSLNGIVGWAIVFGLLGNICGFLLAVVIDQPLGPTLVLSAGSITLCTYAVNRHRH